MMCPSLVVAGLGGDSGKTLLTLGLAATWARRNKKVAPFKKGPDYIDAAWLNLAAGQPCRNLDTFLMTRETIVATWKKYVQDSDYAIVEGNRGLYDGMDTRGSHSTAALSKIIHAPVLLIINATKTTATLGAIVLGMQKYDPDVDILGVVLNNVGGKRHQRVASEAIEVATGIPVVGAIPKLRNKKMIPGRHLGLVTTDEYPQAIEAINTACEAIEEHVNVEKIEKLLEERDFSLDSTISSESIKTTCTDLKIGIIRDPAFPFYYPENLEALKNRGANLVDISAIKDKKLRSNISALYVGGGFPETHAKELAANESFKKSLREAAVIGLPVYAECGGLMYLCRSIEYKNEKYEMAGVLPVDIGWQKKPAGHGYIIGKVDKENPFYELGTEIKGHEFHHSKISVIDEDFFGKTAIELSKGHGVGNHRDAFILNNVFALYAHIHAAGLPQWADGMIEAAQKFKNKEYSK